MTFPCYSIRTPRHGGHTLLGARAYTQVNFSRQLATRMFGDKLATRDQKKKKHTHTHTKQQQQEQLRRQKNVSAGSQGSGCMHAKSAHLADTMLALYCRSSWSRSVSPSSSTMEIRPRLLST